MFKVITPEGWNLAYFALVEICDDDTVRLLRTLNPNAADGIQGESYGEDWKYRSRIAAASEFQGIGFWKAWTDINSKVSGKIYLYDDLCDAEARQFIGAYEYPLVLCDDDGDAADAVRHLKQGVYLFYVPMVEQGVPEEVGQVMAKK